MLVVGAVMAAIPRLPHHRRGSSRDHAQPHHRQLHRQARVGRVPHRGARPAGAHDLRPVRGRRGGRVRSTTPSWSRRRSSTRSTGASSNAACPTGQIRSTVSRIRSTTTTAGAGSTGTTPTGTSSRSSPCRTAAGARWLVSFAAWRSVCGCDGLGEFLCWQGFFLGGCE